VTQQRSNRRLAALAACLLVAVTSSACRQDMHDAAKLEPLEQSSFFKDKRASRPLLPGTVARGKLKEDVLLHTGKDGEALSETFPFPVTAGVVERGRERFDIYCSPCHARTGEGNGMIVQRGYKKPPSFHEERLRAMAPGYFVTAMKNGFGVMPSYALQVQAEDRWAIAAYIKALQLSRTVSVSDLTAEEKDRLDRGETEPPAAEDDGHGGGHGGGHGDAKEAHGG